MEHRRVRGDADDKGVAKLCVRPEPAMPSAGSKTRMELLGLRNALAAGVFATAMLWVGESVADPSEPGEPVDQSIGHPRAGRLRDGARLPRGSRHVLSSPTNAYGTTATVDHLLSVLEGLPDVPHRLVIGDLSSHRGGRLPRHASHQTGRDVDLGLFHQHDPGRRFLEATPDNFDPAATWSLLVALASTHGEPGGVEWILLDYEVQEWLYAWASKSDVEPELVDAMLQYPHGRDADHGMVRHLRRHRNHLHVRFSCPPASSRCRSSALPPGTRP